MTVQVVPYVLQAASHSSSLFRQAMTAPLVPGGGVFRKADTELAVLQQSTPNMSVKVNAGRCVAPGSVLSPPSGFAWTMQGDYFIINDGPVTLTIQTSDPTHPRIDVVYAQVQDSAYSGSFDQASLAVVTGTPASSPAVPSLPANAVALAQVAVAANATTIVTGNITDVRVDLLGNGLGGGGSGITPSYFAINNSAATVSAGAAHILPLDHATIVTVSTDMAIISLGGGNEGIGINTAGLYVACALIGINTTSVTATSDLDVTANTGISVSVASPSFFTTTGDNNPRVIPLASINRVSNIGGVTGPFWAQPGDYVYTTAGIGQLNGSPVTGTFDIIASGPYGLGVVRLA